jgi:hypothetical protein
MDSEDSMIIVQKKLRIVRMMKRRIDLPERYRGKWCDLDRAEDAGAQKLVADEVDTGEALIRTQWAKALLRGDWKTAHTARSLGAGSSSRLLIL